MGGATGQNFWQNPMLQFGMGMLGGNQGITGDAAFRNALRGGMGGVLRGQGMAANIARQRQQTELLQLQHMQAQRQMEQSRQLAAAAPQLSAAMMSGDPEVQRQAYAGIASMSPQMLPKMMAAQFGREPTRESAFAEKLRLAGVDPDTPEGQAFVENYLKKPGISITQPPKPPTGYWYKDPSDPTQGIERMKGFKESPEQAGKRAALSVGRDQAMVVKDALITADAQGKPIVDRDLILSMQTNIPWSEGRQRRQELQDSLQAKLRAETGAAATPSELKDILDRYLPSMLDSDGSVVSKMNRLTEFFDRTLEETDPALFNRLRSRAKQTIPSDKPPWELNQ